MLFLDCLPLAAGTQLRGYRLYTTHHPQEPGTEQSSADTLVTAQLHPLRGERKEGNAAVPASSYPQILATAACKQLGMTQEPSNRPSFPVCDQRQRAVTGQQQPKTGANCTSMGKEARPAACCLPFPLRQ